MARKRTRPWKDEDGRWRSPSGAFASKPARKPAKKPAKKVAPKKSPAKPGPKTAERGHSSPRRPPTSAPPPPSSPKTPKPTWGVRAYQAAKAAKAAAPVITDPFVAFARARVRAAQAAPPSAAELRRRAADAASELPHVEAVTAAARARADRAASMLATDPRFSPDVLHPKDLATFQRTAKTAEAQADELDLAVADKKKEVAEAFQAALAEQRAATARRRAWARGQRVPELEGLVVGQPAPEEVEVGVREGKVPAGKPLTAWDVRKIRGELLGLTPSQVAGKYEEGEVTRAQLRWIEVTLNQVRRNARRTGTWTWTARAEKLREMIRRKGHRTADKMADYFEALGFQRHDGFVVFHRDSPGGGEG